MILINIMYSRVDETLCCIHNYHSPRFFMNAFFLQASAEVAALGIGSRSAVTPSPNAFWAVVTWIIIPGAFLIFIAYHRRQERLRNVRRKLRQLEIRLAIATPTNSASLATPPRPSTLLGRPSALTTRILLPAAATSPVPAFSQSLPSQAGY